MRRAKGILSFLSKILDMHSIWEHNSLLRYDALIVGGGIVGLSAAIFLKERFPERRVAVLERGLLPSGASTRNAGFACMGSLTEILDDLQHSSEETVRELFALRQNGLRRLRTMLGDEAMGYAEKGSYELLRANEAAALDELGRINRLLLPVTGTPAFRLCDEKLPVMGFAGVKHVIENCLEGELDTGMMMRSLTDKALKAGMECKTGCTVLRFEERAGGVEVHCKDPLSDEVLTFHSEQLFICQNAFARTLLPEADVRPGRGQVLLTEPIEDLPFHGIYHFDRGYYYFRRYQNRLLFGGGRQLDFKGEETLTFGLNEAIQSDLEEKLRTLILPGHQPEIAMRWSGIMAFGADKKPILHRHSDRVFVGVRMGGMGVAIGSEVGYRLSRMAQ